MHWRLWPSTVAVAVVVPFFKKCTVPSASMVAIDVSAMLQLTAEEVPLTFNWNVVPAGMVISSRFRDRVVLPEGAVVVDVMPLMRTMQVAEVKPSVTVTSVVPFPTPVTVPLSDTVATLVSALLQVYVPLPPEGVNVYWSPLAASRVKSLLFRATGVLGGVTGVSSPPSAGSVPVSSSMLGITPPSVPGSELSPPESEGVWLSP